MYWRHCLLKSLASRGKGEFLSLLVEEYCCAGVRESSFHCLLKSLVRGVRDLSCTEKGEYAKNIVRGVRESSFHYLLE